MGVLRPALVRLGLVLGFALAACAGGQSGTETLDMTPPRKGVGQNVPDAGGQSAHDDHVKGGVAAAVQSCMCTSSDRALLLRATLQSTDACQARARVTSVLSPADADVSAGDVVGGAIVTYGGCGSGRELAVGDDVLLAYTPGVEADAGAARLDGQLLIARWADPLVFGHVGGKAIELARKDIDQLLDPAACSARFPAENDALDASAPQCAPPR